jgi:biopolymer transport protein ExbD
MNLKPRKHDEVDITLISFIDVVLVLIVFFMLSSEFVNEGRVRVRLPQAAGAPPAARQQTEPLVVTVTQSGSYRVNEQELINSSPDTLRAALVKVAGQDRAMRVTLRADGRATHQSVITAMDVLGRLGFSEINVATVKDAPADRP